MLNYTTNCSLYDMWKMLVKSEIFNSLINPFMPSVPKNGTPGLTANYKIIQALMG